MSPKAMDEIRRIKESYDRRKNLPASRYSYFDSGNLFITQGRERHLLRVLKAAGFDYLSGKSILDVGCGVGRSLHRFVDYGALPQNLFGIDLLPDLVDLARLMNPGIKFQCANAESLPFDDEFFDMVTQSTAFTSILDPHMKANIALEMLRVLKPDGMILWYDFLVNNPRNPDVRGVGSREIHQLFPQCDIALKRVTLAPPLVRRLVKLSWTGALLLEKIPMLCTHYIGVIRKSNVRDKS